MTRRVRTTFVRGVLPAAAVLLAVALGGCAKQQADIPGTVGDAQAAAPPDPTASVDPSQDPAVNQDKAAPPADLTTKLVATAIPKMGQTVTDQQGRVAYRFDKDTAGQSPKSNCIDKCEKVWPPMLTDGNPQLEGVSPDKVGSIVRPDGTRQITLGGWALYRYIGDQKPGQWKGQGVGGTWWVAAPDGKKNLTCVPTGTPTAVAPPPDAQAPGNGGGSTGGGNNGGGGAYPGGSY